MEFINPLAEKYSEQISSPENELLYQIHRETQASHAQPHMLSGQVQGRFLSFLSKIIHPNFILEIGTFTGYSALCLAEGLQPQGELHTIELRENDALTAQQNFDKSVFKNKIYLHTGNAADIIPALPYKWDLVFIDADKTNYIHYYELVLPQLNKGGIIVADNVLFHGKLLESTVKGKNTTAIEAFNRYVAKDERTEQVLLTLRDGLLLIKKK